MTQNSDLPSTKTRWLRDFLRFLPLKSQFVLSGNVHDLQTHEVQPGVFSPISVQATLASELYASGYAQVFSIDCVRGVRGLSRTGNLAPATEFLTRLGISDCSDAAGLDLNALGLVLDRIVSIDEAPIAVLVDLASRMIARPEALSREEHPFFSRAQLLSLTAKPKPFGPEKKPFFNTVIWIIEHESDLPNWLVLDNPRIRHIPVAKPDNIARGLVIPALVRTLPNARTATLSDLKEAETEFTELTEGLLLADLQAISQLARSENLPFDQIADAIRRYKVGVTEDPWRKIDRRKIRNASEEINLRVRGQEHAVTHVLDIIKRAVTGVGAPKRGNRPRGVAFFAGPTGVGKTELAKTITNLLFGDESAYIRFDMSEFAAEHADQRLIGAPPGYVGYDAGGELTNAVREKPFSVVLFDEIEKAHPRILDKFLQILDDGVLTSGRGDRVYFSEAFIVFTSNLGIYKLDGTGDRVLNVSQEDSTDNIKAKVRSEIDRYFKTVLNRPEILNRIGENIIVFDFIRPQIAHAIFNQMVDAILRDLEQSEMKISITSEAREQLASRCLHDLSNGGRGIRNQVEAFLVNPLARALFDNDAKAGSCWRITRVSTEAIATLNLEPDEVIH